jgi:enamine deaminase RidA (YjgF/YER057c/UK114 family)
MAGLIESRLKTLGIELPDTPAPAGNYVPYVRTGAVLFVSGQLPMWQGELHFPGKLGLDLDLKQGKAAARLVGLNILAQARAGAGDLDLIRRCVRVGAFVACVEGFTQQPEVVNGISDLLVEVLGDAGRHVRAAVGVNVLPRNASVEADAIFELG